MWSQIYAKKEPKEYIFISRWNKVSPIASWFAETFGSLVYFIVELKLCHVEWHGFTAQDDQENDVSCYYYEIF